MFILIYFKVQRYNLFMEKTKKNQNKIHNTQYINYLNRNQSKKRTCYSLPKQRTSESEGVCKDVILGQTWGGDTRSLHAVSLQAQPRSHNPHPPLTQGVASGIGEGASW